MSLSIAFLLGAALAAAVLAAADHFRARKPGRVVKLINKERKFGADKVYWAVWVQHEGVLSHWLLTKEDVLRLFARSDKNPEDRAP